MSVLPGTSGGRVLDAGQTAWAVRVVDECYRNAAVGDRDVVCALACVAQESGFRMYANDGSAPNLTPEQADAVRASLALPHDAVGHDSASVGLFQQQPYVPGRSWGWGTVAECMDAEYSTRSFLAALLRLTNRDTTPVTVLVQAVQRSSFPDAYAKHEAFAWAFLVAYWRARAAAPDPAPPVVEDFSPVLDAVAAVGAKVDALAAVAAEVRAVFR